MRLSPCDQEDVESRPDRDSTGVKIQGGTCQASKARSQSHWADLEASEHLATERVRLLRLLNDKLSSIH